MNRIKYYKTRVRSKGQATIPNQIREVLDIQEGDGLVFFVKDGRVLVEREQTIDPEQAWFWTERWQQMERSAQDAFDNGQGIRHSNIDNALNALGGQEDDACD